MKSNKEKLIGCLPQTPQGVTHAVQLAFQQIHRETASNPPRRYARRLSFSAVVLIVLLTTAIGIAAGIHFGVFDFMAQMFGQSGVLSKANELVQSDLATLETEHTVITLSQVVYDGGNLRLVYSIQQKGANSPTVKADLENETSDFREKLTADGVSMRGCDWFYLDGIEYSMTNGSYVDSIPGTGNGQALCYMDIYLASAGIVPQEDFQVGLPIIRHGRNDYEMLDFTVKANATSSVLPTLHKNGATITVLSSSLSPVRAYVNLRIEMDAEATEAQMDIAFADWQDAHPQLVDKNGKPLSELCEYQINNLAEGKSFELSLVFLPSDAEEVFIAPAIFTDNNEWMGDMTKAIQIK